MTEDVNRRASGSANGDPLGENDEVLDRVRERISVTPPYFALTDLTEVGPGRVTATVTHTPPTSPEAGTVEAAQVARHLAILGSCAAALSRDDADKPQRHHYLATKAHFVAIPGTRVDEGARLEAEAVATWADRRSARSLVTLKSPDGRALNMLDVEYAVMTPRMFHRLNPTIDQDRLDPIGLQHAGQRVNGERVSARPEPEVVDTADGVELDLGPIPASLCAGHFPDYPAAPVAILMGQLCRVAGVGLARALGRCDHRYRIQEGWVTATRLAVAGQRLVMRASYDSPTDRGHRMTGVAEADGEVVGELTVVMSLHNPAPADPEPDSGTVDPELEAIELGEQVEVGYDLASGQLMLAGHTGPT